MEGTLFPSLDIAVVKCYSELMQLNYSHCKNAAGPALICHLKNSSLNGMQILYNAMNAIKS